MMMTDEMIDKPDEKGVYLNGWVDGLMELKKQIEGSQTLGVWNPKSKAFEGEEK